MEDNVSTALRMKRGKEVMKKRWLTAFALLIGITATIGALSWLPIQASAAGSEGTTYYFSTLNGDNNNSGTSQEQAWASLNMLEEKNITLQAGDKVYLERGSIFNNEFLHLREVKGTQDAPIVIDAYGDSGKAARVRIRNKSVRRSVPFWDALTGSPARSVRWNRFQRECCDNLCRYIRQYICAGLYIHGQGKR